MYLFVDIYIAQEFDLAEWYSHILKSQHKHNISIVIYSWITTETQFPLLVSIYMLTTTALGGVPSCEEGIHALKPAQAHCSFQNSSCWSLGFYTSIRLSYIYTSLLPLLSPPHCTTQWPTGAAVYLKQRSPSRPTCVEVRSAFFMIISSHSLCSSLSSSFLSISSDALVVICWLVTSPCNETGWCVSFHSYACKELANTDSGLDCLFVVLFPSLFYIFL